MLQEFKQHPNETAEECFQKLHLSNWTTQIQDISVLFYRNLDKMLHKFVPLTSHFLHIFEGFCGICVVEFVVFLYSHREVKLFQQL